MESFWSGVVGALIGGAATGLTAWLAFRAQRRATAADAAALMRRQLADSLVRSLADFRECRANPAANAAREREVHSRLEADLALFNGSLTLPRDVALKEYLARIRVMIFKGANGWADEVNFSGSIGDPILRWAVGDREFGAAWFESRSSRSDGEFRPEPRQQD